MRSREFNLGFKVGQIRQALKNAQVCLGGIDRLVEVLDERDRDLVVQVEDVIAVLIQRLDSEL